LLRREGGTGILVSVDDEHGTTFSDLADHVHVTRNTLSNRLDEATDLDLLKETMHPSDHGNAVRYALTLRGEQVRFLLDESEMGQLYAEFLRTRQEMEDGIEFVEEVYDPKPYDPEFEEYMREKETDE
jgi:DNA-binding HxlR family transcriptional regulator